MDSTKRRKDQVAKDDRSNLARELKQSNTTTAAFLGAKFKSWMDNGSPLPKFTKQVPESTTATLKGRQKTVSSGPAIGIVSKSPLVLEKSFPGDPTDGPLPSQGAQIHNDKDISRESCPGVTSERSRMLASLTSTPGSESRDADNNCETPMGNGGPFRGPRDQEQQMESTVANVSTSKVQTPVLPVEDATTCRQLAANRLPNDLQAHSRKIDGGAASSSTREIPASHLMPLSLDVSSPKRRGRPPGSKNVDSTPKAQMRGQERGVPPRKKLQSESVSLSAAALQPLTSRRTIVTQDPSIVNPPAIDMHHLAHLVTVRMQDVSKLEGRGLYEWPRLELLQQACHIADYSYLLLHQIFCSRHLSSLSNAQSPNLTEKQETGLSMLSDLLASNTDVRPNALEWFAAFPMQLDQWLVFYPSTIRSAYERVLVCLSTLAQKWSDLRALSSQRHYPPLACETSSFLNVDSPVLQRVINRAVLRDLWIGPVDHCYHQVEEVFNEDQQSVADALAHNTHVNDEAYKNWVISKYKRLWNVHLTHVHPSSRHALSSDIAPNASINQSLTQSSMTRHHSGLYGNGPVFASECERTSNTDVHNTQELVNDDLIVSAPSFRGAPSANGIGMAQSHAPNIVLSNRHQPYIAVTQSSPQNEINPQSPPESQNSPLQRRMANIVDKPADDHRRNQSLSRTSLPLDFSATDRILSNIQHGNINPSNNQIPPLYGSGWQDVGSIGPPVDYVRRHSRPTVNQDATRPHQPGHLTQPSESYDGMSILTPQPLSHHSVQGHPSTNAHKLRTHSDQFIRIPRPNSANSLPNQPHPMRTALHQIHAMSPELQQTNCRELFQFIKDVIMPPEALSRHAPYQQWGFSLNEEDTRSLAMDTVETNGWRASRRLVHGSRTYRVRCLKLTTDQTSLSQHDWVVADHTWPAALTILLNGVALEMRRKSHHGKDLPIDITQCVKTGGNHLTVAILDLPENALDRVMVAVEVIEAIESKTLQANIPTVDSQRAKTSIIAQTKSSDAEIEILNRQIAIDLKDPFAASIYNVPVRGMLCRHTQCFDLGIFLETRFGKNTNEPCSPDSFRCPICGGDVRPPNLVKDGFLLEVRAELEKKGRLDAKAITLHETGDWDIKEDEELTGEAGDGTGKKLHMQPLRQNAGTGTALGASDGGAREVIELD